jgi:hypothetical protein
MTLLQDGMDRYITSPTSQLDWFYEMTKVSDTKWVVEGSKDDYLCPAYYGPESKRYTFEWIDNRWELTKLTHSDSIC